MSGVLPGLLIGYKLLTVLVDAVVGEVDHVVPNVSRIIAVRNGGKPDQPIFIDIELHRLNTGQQNIQAEIKLEPIDEEWVVNILLHIRLEIMKLKE